MALKKKKLLVVDDEKDFIDTLAERLEARGFEILRAYDGKEGLEKAYKDSPDLIILDIAMPVMNGFDLCRKLKIDDKVKKIPVIMLSAKFQPNDVKFSMELGAEAYLTKPLELDVLLEKVRELLKMGKGRKDKAADGSA